MVMVTDRRSRGKVRTHNRVVRACAALAALILAIGSLIMVRLLDTPDIAVGYDALVVVWPLTMMTVCLLGGLTLWAARRPWRYIAGWVVVCVGSVPGYVLLALGAGAASASATMVNLALGLLIVDAVIVLTGWIGLTDQATPGR